MAPARIALAALFVMLPSCNAILGMERAHLDPGDAGAETQNGAGGKPVMQTGSGGTPISGGQNHLPECTQNSDVCLQCLDEKCGSDVSATCLGSADCRNGVYRHAACVANHLCRDMTCASTIEDNPLVSCYSACVDQCTDRALMPICNLYCACMQDQCHDQFMSSLGGSMQDCIDTCKSTPSIHDNALCREDHCELVPKYGADPHCLHAIGMLGQCTGPISICTSGMNTGLGPCTVDGDCCSHNCQGNVCAP